MVYIFIRSAKLQLFIEFVIVLAHKYLGHKEWVQALQPQQSSLRFIFIIKNVVIVWLSSHGEH